MDLNNPIGMKSFEPSQSPFIMNPFRFASGGPVGGWVELARTTLGSANSSLSNLGFADKRYYMILIDEHGQNSASTNNFFRAGSSGSLDTGSNYAGRQNSNGTGDGVYINQSSMIAPISSANGVFHVQYAANLSGKEKLFMGWKNDIITAGAGSNPYRKEFAWKHVQTANPLDSFELNTGGGDTFNSGSEIVVLGWDPADTHTTNFWEELASTNGTGVNNITSGTFPAKKYLWVQIYADKSLDGTQNLTFNNDTGSNYSSRLSFNGGADTTGTSGGSIVQGNDGLVPHFSNYFIINNSANEKLVIGHTVFGQTAAASNDPTREEVVGKWANTSAQITEIDLINSNASNVYSSSSLIKVWGSD